MSLDRSSDTQTQAETTSGTKESLAAHIEENVDVVAELHRREWEGVSNSQRRLEQVSRFVARPLYLVGLLTVVVAWVGLNLLAEFLRWHPLDSPPFAWLDTVLTVVALLTTTIVLIAQNRQAKLEQLRSHLNLQLIMLAEQKVTKVIHLLEELRRDLPFVENRRDEKALIMQEAADASQVLSAIQEGGVTQDAEAPQDLGRCFPEHGCNQ
jgi:uncharacterized membrane protein